MANKTKRTVPAEVLEKYEMVDHECGLFESQKYGRVDFATITLVKAEALCKAGFHFIRRKEKAKKARE